MDRFVGVSSLNLCNEGSWLTTQILSLNASDAGTNDGLYFNSTETSLPLDKQTPIFKYDFLNMSNPFYNPNNETNPLLPLAEFTINQDKGTAEDIGGSSA